MDDPLPPTAAKKRESWKPLEEELGEERVGALCLSPTTFGVVLSSVVLVALAALAAGLAFCAKAAKP